mgnify:CR=1 FL=1
MAKLIGVRVNRLSQIVYFDPGDVDINLLDQVEVEVDESIVKAEVVISPDQVIYSEVSGPLKRIIRKITKE